MQARDLDTVPPDQICGLRSARDIVVLIGVLCQGEIKVFMVELTTCRMWSWQKTIATTRHDQVDDGESARDTVLLVGLLHQGRTTVLRKGIAR